MKLLLLLIGIFLGMVLLVSAQDCTYASLSNSDVTSCIGSNPAFLSEREDIFSTNPGYILENPDKVFEAMEKDFKIFSRISSNEGAFRNFLIAVERDPKKLSDNPKVFTELGKLYNFDVANGAGLKEFNAGTKLLITRGAGNQITLDDLKKLGGATILADGPIKLKNGATIKNAKADFTQIHTGDGPPIDRLQISRGIIQLDPNSQLKDSIILSDGAKIEGLASSYDKTVVNTLSLDYRKGSQSEQDILDSYVKALGYTPTKEVKKALFEQLMPGDRYDSSKDEKFILALSKLAEGAVTVSQYDKDTLISGAGYHKENPFIGTIEVAKQDDGLVSLKEKTLYDSKKQGVVWKTGTETKLMIEPQTGEVTKWIRLDGLSGKASLTLYDWKDKTELISAINFGTEGELQIFYPEGNQRLDSTGVYRVKGPEPPIKVISSYAYTDPFFGETEKYMRIYSPDTGKIKVTRLLPNSGDDPYFQDAYFVANTYNWFGVTTIPEGQNPSDVLASDYNDLFGLPTKEDLAKDPEVLKREIFVKDLGVIMTYGDYLALERYDYTPSDTGLKKVDSKTKTSDL